MWFLSLYFCCCRKTSNSRKLRCSDMINTVCIPSSVRILPASLLGGDLAPQTRDFCAVVLKGEECLLCFTGCLPPPAVTAAEISTKTPLGLPAGTQGDSSTLTPPSCSLVRCQVGQGLFHKACRSLSSQAPEQIWSFHCSPLQSVLA